MDARRDTSVERFTQDKKMLAEIETRYLNAQLLDGLTNDELVLHFQQCERLVSELAHPHALRDFFALGALHLDPEVRKFCLRYAGRLSHCEPSARELIQWLLGDDEDHVIFEAIRIAGQKRVGEAVEELLRITGPPSETIKRSTKPVGVGASLVTKALIEIFGTEDPERLRNMESAFERDGILPDGALFDDAWLYAEGIDDRPGMIRIPSGTFVAGIDGPQLPHRRFDCSDVIPARKVHLPDFLIDIYPVTCAEYDDWTSSTEAEQHYLCHPDEPDGKDHRRGTRRDPRIASNHPVVGVDWYDAYSYCAHHGKELPSEMEWEKAARGVDGRLFPWGDSWESGAAQWAGVVFAREIDDIWTWRKLLQNHDEHHPRTMTAPIDAHPSGASPYVVMDMVGNCWEWTRTNFYTRRNLEPRIQGRPRPEWSTSPECFVVIKGGAWSSIPEETSTFFRGTDLLTDRHNEIGFRGVVR